MKETRIEYKLYYKTPRCFYYVEGKNVKIFLRLVKVLHHKNCMEKWRQALLASAIKK
jgi:hypothetical protein